MSNTQDRPAEDPIVLCRGLSKSYGEFRALIDCTLEVRPGDIFGLLGPNGAGKTTLIRSLLGFLRTTAGRAVVCGHDPAEDSVEVRRNVAYLPGDARLPRHLRGHGVLRFFSQLHPRGNLQRSLELADALELDTSRRVGMMSTGMRQKLALAIVLAPSTPLMILDEPTANLDPTVRATVLDLVREANAQGRTVILSSHVLSEIEETCNRVAFLRRGVLAHQLEMDDLFQRHRVWGELRDQHRPDDGTLSAMVPEELRQAVEVHSVSTTARNGVYPIRIDIAGDLAKLLPWITSLQLQRIRIEPLGLRAVYDSVHRDTLRFPREAPESLMHPTASGSQDSAAREASV
ncbi:ATP-binding cassette domain-containing protein [Roseiconus nitratireducens]|uniref:ATP-binding cassette domain-containing protein n=1 Tax=Roseiconus nitratireducens TaxID=2605748 RepID=UPI0028F4427B|nr:ATP-binding cassette domain-containing protein [Roseiconus nitratireducens]